MKLVNDTGRGWAYAAIVVGGVVSLVANVAHSYVPPVGALAGWEPEKGAVAAALFWPTALFLAVEVMVRIAWPRTWWSVLLRTIGLAPVALVAAAVSYQHLSGLLAYYGEPPLTAMAGPIAVDGLMVMATGALVATSRPHQPTVKNPVLTMAYRQPAGPVLPPATATAVTGQQDSRPTQQDSSPVPPDTAPVNPQPSPATRSDQGTKPDVATAVARLRRHSPQLTQAEIAKQVGVSERTVRRHLSTQTA